MAKMSEVYDRLFWTSTVIEPGARNGEANLTQCSRGGLMPTICAGGMGFEPATDADTNMEQMGCFAPWDVGIRSIASYVHASKEDREIINSHALLSMHACNREVLRAPLFVLDSRMPLEDRIKLVANSNGRYLLPDGKSEAEGYRLALMLLASRFDSFGVRLSVRAMPHLSKKARVTVMFHCNAMRELQP